MRRNQVTIKVERFGEAVPESLNASVIQVSAYADSNNIYEALSVAYKEILNELNKYEKQPGFGCSSSHTTVIKHKTNLEDN